MLASEQPGEADAARRKLLEHLGHHRLSLTDVAQRLREPPRPPAPGGGEMGMERQLHIARVARQEAEFDVQRARQRVGELSRSLQESGLDAARALAGQARARLFAAVGWLLAGAAGAVLLGQHVHQRSAAAEQAAAAANQAMIQPVDPDQNDQVLRPAPNERLGTVMVQDLAVRVTPTNDGEVRAFLNRGTSVVLMRQVRLGPQTWFLLRSVSGVGWVHSGDVRY